MWRAVRDELSGAWRSLRYDLRRKPAPEDPGSSGTTEYDAFEGGPRRILVSSGMAALVLGGAVGGYFGVVNGMDALLQPRPATVPQPAADGLVTAGPVDRGAAPARRVPATKAPVRGGQPAAPAGPTVSGHGGPARHPKTRPAPRRARPPVPTPAPSCSCAPPPAPVPSSSNPASPTPTPSVSPTPDPDGAGGGSGSSAGSGGSARPHAW
jgi:hypothetical protein